MECIQCHLCCGFSDRLSSNCADTLTRLSDRRRNFSASFSKDPDEGFLAELELASHAQRGEGRPEVDAEEVSGVFSILSRSANMELLTELLDRIDHFDGIE